MNECDEEELKNSNEKYRLLFTCMKNGFALQQVVTDDSGKPVDYIVLEINPAFEALTGFKKEMVQNKRITEVVPDFSPEWVKLCGNVALGGEPVKTEIFSRPSKKHLSVSVFSPEKGKFATLVEDITEKVEAEQKLTGSLKEKETLLKELYHRTKNNMQMIMALLDLQSSFLEDKKISDIFLDTKNRIHSMALVHKMLYETSDLSKINLKTYIQNLVISIIDSYDLNRNKITLELDLEDIVAVIDVAIPCGIILNELITNSIKHGFLRYKADKIRISIKRPTADRIRLEVSDNGKNLPKDFNIARHGKLGIQNIISLGEFQLDGKVKINTENGFSCEVVFDDAMFRPGL